MASDNLKPVVIWDIDNCLADDKWRAHLIDWDKTGNDRYTRYNMRMRKDKPCNVELFHASCREATPVFFTGRCAQYRHDTQWWLWYILGYANWNLQLFMRPDDCNDTPCQLKERMLLDLMKQGPYRIVGAFDDLPTIIEMYQRHGIPARQLAINEDFSGIYLPIDLK